MLDLGKVLSGRTIRIPFSSFDKDDGSSITMTSFAAADILIYKDGSTTERASTSGYTATTDFDGKTGKHVAIIDLADNTTADFFAAGSEYLVGIDAVTVDGVTVGPWIGRFEIGIPGAILDTTIATLASQTSFTLTAGPADNNALVGCVAVIRDAASAVQQCLGVVSAYTGSTKTVALLNDPGVFTMAAKDNISFIPDRSLKPATDNRNLTVNSGGDADANVTKLLGTAHLTPGTPGTPDVNAKLIGGDATAATNAKNFWSGALTAGTAQAGAAGTITLAAGASASNDYYKFAAITIVSGTGAGQTREITAYVGATKVATVDANWVTNPDATSVYQIIGRIV